MDRTSRTREELSARAAAIFRYRSFPRLTILIVLALSGAASFLVSVILLDAGMTRMRLRYPLAGVAGYVAFIGLIRLWITYHRRSPSWEDAIDAIDLADTGARATISETSPLSIGAGGRSGGAGASTSWGRAAEASAGEAAGGMLDVDEIWYVMMLGVIAFAGFIGLAYIVYVAPLLLAEVALDAALVSTLYAKLRRQDVRHWSKTLVRRTWLPAAGIIVTLALTGLVMQLAAPGAKSIGGVVAALLN